MENLTVNFQDTDPDSGAVPMLIRILFYSFPKDYLTVLPTDNLEVHVDFHLLIGRKNISFICTVFNGTASRDFRPSVFFLLNGTSGSPDSWAKAVPLMHLNSKMKEQAELTGMLTLYSS
jgi:hypothetical protein